MSTLGLFFKKTARINEARNRLDYSAANKFFVNEEVGGESGDDFNEVKHTSYSGEY